jgi:Transposase/Transposase IS116/IS110/IS902 family
VDDGERTMDGLPGRLTGDDQGAARVTRPEQVDVWIGLDVGKEDHFAEVPGDAGERIFARGVANDEAALEALVDRAGQHGTVGLVIDQPGSIAQLTLAVAACRQVPVAYVPGLVMRRAAELYPGEAKTGKRDAFIIADTGRTRRRQEIEEVFLAHPVGELLSALPGIGPRTGSRILAEIGDGTRFAYGARLASYAGLAPVTRQPGKPVNGESQSRRGGHRLKNAMFLAAFASLRDPDSKAFYDRKRTEGKRHNAALLGLARRRCDVIPAMLTTRQPGQPVRSTDRREIADAA